MTKIIAFVDGSVYSKSVCDHAAWIAKRSGAGVGLLHVLGPRETADGADLSGAISLGARTALMEQLAGLDAERAKLMGHRGRAILEDAAAIVAGEGVADVTTQLRHGDFAQTVAEQEAGAAMVLIGKRGEGSTMEAEYSRIGLHLERSHHLTLHGPAEVQRRLRLETRICCNNILAARQFTLAGMGVSLQPEPEVRELLARGELLPLLAAASSRSIRVTVFIAVNCSELQAPIRLSWMINCKVEVCASTRARLAIRAPSSRVLLVRMLR